MKAYRSGYWYSSQLRPANGLFIPNVIEVENLTDKISDEKQYYSAIRTSQRLSNSTIYDYDLTPLNEQSWMEVFIDDFLDYDNLEDGEIAYLLKLSKPYLQSYLLRFIRDRNKYANALTIPDEQLECLRKQIVERLKERSEVK